MHYDRAENGLPSDSASTLMSVRRVRSTRTQREHVAQKNRALRRDQLIAIQTFENLTVSVLQQPDFDGPLHEVTFVGCDPNRHCAVAFSDNAIDRNSGRARQGRPFESRNLRTCGHQAVLRRILDH